MQISHKVDFIGIGVPRAGTTWIHKCLEAHPQLCLPLEKSLKDFFTEEVLKKRDFAGYQSYFSHCRKGQKRGHIETGLLYSGTAPFPIRELFPEVKLIVCLRNPIERFYSHYLLKKSRGEPFFSSEHRERGLYFLPLKRYFDIFPKEQILVLIYEEIRTDPIKFIQNIYRFLGVNHAFLPKYLDQKINPTAKTRQRVPLVNRYNVIRTSHFLKQSGLGRKILAISKSMKFPRLINFIISKNVQDDLALGIRPAAQKPAILPKTRAYLQEFYKEDITKLEKLLGRDLSFWK